MMDILDPIINREGLDFKEGSLQVITEAIQTRLLWLFANADLLNLLSMNFSFVDAEQEILKRAKGETSPSFWKERL